VWDQKELMGPRSFISRLLPHLLPAFIWATNSMTCGSLVPAPMPFHLSLSSGGSFFFTGVSVVKDTAGVQ